MKDARRRQREVVDQFFPVVNRDTEELIGYLADVTVDGGMIESEQPPAEGATLALRVELTEPIDGGRHIDVDAVCMWTRKDRNAVFHRIGFEFRDVTEETRRRIAILAQKYRLTPTG